MKKQIETRMNRMFGQLSGVQKMIDNDENVSKIMVQLCAIRGVLDRLAMILTEREIKRAIALGLEPEEADLVSRRMASIIHDYFNLVR